MPLINGRLTTPFSFADVANCLGENTEDLGELCESPYVNMWAKYHPVRNGAREPLSEDAMRAEAYGLISDIVYSLGNQLDVARAYSDALRGAYSWVYLQPRGEAFGEWHRHTDFDGYYHYAECPFNMQAQDLTRGKLDISVEALYNLDEGNITLSDLAEIGGLGLITGTADTCFGYIYTKAGEDVPTLIGGDGEYPAFVGGQPASQTITANVGAGTYTVVPVIINTSVGLFATLPLEAQEYRVTTENVSGNIEIYGEWYVKADGSAIILNGEICSDVDLAAGIVAVFVCPVGTAANEIDESAIITTSYNYAAVAPGSCSVFAQDERIVKTGVNYNNVEVWARVTTSAGMAVVQLDQTEDNDIQ